MSDLSDIGNVLIEEYRFDIDHSLGPFVPAPGPLAIDYRRVVEAMKSPEVSPWDGPPLTPAMLLSLVERDTPVEVLEDVVSAIITTQGLSLIVMDELAGMEHPVFISPGTVHPSLVKLITTIVLVAAGAPPLANMERIALNPVDRRDAVEWGRDKYTVKFIVEAVPGRARSCALHYGRLRVMNTSTERVVSLFIQAVPQPPQ